jgi:hypothetical protein
MKFPAFQHNTRKRAAFVVLPVCVALFFLLSRSSPDRVPLAETIRDGMRFYDAPEALNALRVDDAFLFQAIGRARSGSSYRLPTDIADRFAGDPFLRIIDAERGADDLVFFRRAEPLRPLPNIENNSYLVNTPYERFLRDPYDDILLKALYCDTTGYTDTDFSILKSVMTGAGDYADTHALWGLAMLRANSCYDPEPLAAEMEILAKAVAAAADRDGRFSDLYAERLVLLYWSGHGDMVREPWVRFIRDHLTDDPGWRDGDDVSANAHTTGLALLALLYFEAGEPSQPLFSR